jgi:isoleucyl-tRNA synthetase
MVIMMDTTISEELRVEGFARDLIRAIQDLRKEAGYDVSDRIKLTVSGEYASVILATHQAYIESETLSTILSTLE